MRDCRFGLPVGTEGGDEYSGAGRSRSLPFFTSLGLTCVAGVPAADIKPEESPGDHLPPHFTRLTVFGERESAWRLGPQRLLNPFVCH